MKIFKSKWISLSLVALTVMSSCQSEFDKVIPAAPPLNANLQFRTPKVLYIIADGARGTSVRDADVPTLKTLINNSIYSWNSLADENQTNATNWANMITGVGKDKHGVVSEDFAGNKLADYPSIFTRIKAINPKMRIATFAASASFKDRLTGGTDVSEALGTDVAVKSRLVEFLKTDTASIVLGQFGAIDIAGKASGFDNSFPAYKAAINTFDTQVGEIITAIKGRANYSKENWLIIVTSNKGGQFTLPANQDDRTIFSNTNVNTFTIIHNADYKPTFIVKPFLGNVWSGNAPRFRADVDPESARGRALYNGVNVPGFNFGSGGSFTVSAKVKKRKNPLNTSRGDYYYQWPSFLGKRASPGWGAGNPGWDFCLIQNTWRFYAAGGPSWGDGTEILGINFSGDSWHDLTAVVERKADGRTYVRVYTDGVLGVTNNPGNQLVGGAVSGSQATPRAAEVQLAGAPNFDNTAPMRLGYAGGTQLDGNFGRIDVNLAEVKIFNTALTTDVVRQFACETSIDQSHPNYPNLVAYWPLNEGSGTKMADMGPLTADFTGEGTFQWEQFSDLVCTPSISNVGALVPKNSDIPAQILSWFNIARQTSWGLEGKVWVSQ